MERRRIEHGRAVVRAALPVGWLLVCLAGHPSCSTRHSTIRTSNSQTAPTVDHTLLDQILKKHVDAAGWVDYTALDKNADRLDQYLKSLAAAPLDRLTRDERLALLINAYNAFTLRLILDYWDDGNLTSIKDIPDGKRWDDRRWNIGGAHFSLNDIEHRQIRTQFQEPRIHFAVVCAAVGCPPLRNEAYRGHKLDAQLDSQTHYVHDHARWFRYEPENNRLQLTRLYDWYEADFGGSSGSVIAFAARYSPQLRKGLGVRANPQMQWLPYDWRLNAAGNRPDS